MPRTNSLVPFALLILWMQPSDGAQTDLTFVNIQRTLHENGLEIQLRLPSQFRDTQPIYCPGSMVYLQAHADISFRNKEGRVFGFSSATGSVSYLGGEPPSKAATAEIAAGGNLLRPNDRYVFYGPESTGVRLVCSPIDGVLPEESYSEFYYWTYREIGSGACSFVRYEGSAAYFSCGFGFNPTAGCVDYQEGRKRACFWPGKWHDLDEIERADPGLIADIRRIEPYTSYPFADRIEALNYAAESGDPYYTVSRERDRQARERKLRMQTEVNVATRPQTHPDSRATSPRAAYAPVLQTAQVREDFPYVGIFLLVAGIVGVLAIARK